MMPELDLSCLPEGCECFFTGSRVYGAPTPESDFDLVLLVTVDTLSMLHDAATRCVGCRGAGMNSKGTNKCIPCQGTGRDESRIERVVVDAEGKIAAGSFKFGSLNVMAMTSRAAFMVWKKGTQALARRKEVKGPVSREEATAYFREGRKKFLRKS